MTVWMASWVIKAFILTQPPTPPPPQKTKKNKKKNKKKDTKKTPNALKLVKILISVLTETHA